MKESTRNKLPIAEIKVAYEPTSDIAQYVVRSDMENFDYEVLENYINILALNSEKDSRTMAFAVGYDVFSSLEQYRIDSDMARVFVSDIKNFIVDSIDKGFYVSFHADVYYIANYTHKYQIDHGVHEILIYGYDLHENIFYASDYFDFTNRTFEEIKISQIEDSFNLGKASFYENPTYENPVDRELDYYSYLNKIHLLKLDLTKKRELKIERVISEIERFLTGRRLYNCENIHFGIKFLDLLGERLVSDEISQKHYYLLTAHITLMIERMEIIFKKYNVGNTEVLDKLSVLNDESKTLSNLVVKYDVTKNIGVQKRCCDTITEIREKYSNELYRCLEILSRL